MTIDRVKPLKLESADTGGTQDDAFPTSVNQYQDYVEARGLVLADATRSDETTVIARENADMLFKDGNNTTYVTLTQLLGGGGGLTEAAHEALRQLIHFIDNGPAENFASGAYREMTGTVFPTAIIWYDKATAGKKKIVEKDITWTGVLPTTIAWKIYDASETLLVTATDTVTYSGVFETSRVRVLT